MSAIARELGALSSAALVADVERRGAEVLGTSLRGAPAAVVARAAAALEPPLARAVIDAASRDGTATARDDARRRVTSIGKHASAEALRELGARSLGAALAGRGAAAGGGSRSACRPRPGGACWAGAGLDARWGG